MSLMHSNARRILIVDDNPAIHEDFRKVLLTPPPPAALNRLESEIFGDPAAHRNDPQLELVSAFQGKEALERLIEAMQDGRPFAMAFIDMRMPPGWDGLQTIEQLRRVDPNLNVVVCTAYSDYTPEQICERLEIRDGFLFIRKPFDPADVRAIAQRMTAHVRAVA